MVVSDDTASLRRINICTTPLVHALSSLFSFEYMMSNGKQVCFYDWFIYLEILRIFYILPWHTLVNLRTNNVFKGNEAQIAYEQIQKKPSLKISAHYLKISFMSISCFPTFKNLVL